MRDSSFNGEVRAEVAFGDGTPIPVVAQYDRT